LCLSNTVEKWSVREGGKGGGVVNKIDARNHQGLHVQQCAATHQSLFAKAAASGAKFARPAQQQFSVSLLL